MTYGQQAAGNDQPPTGWERPTGPQPTGPEPPPGQVPPPGYEQPSGYVVQAPPVPQPPPGMTPPLGMTPPPGMTPPLVAPGNRRRMWIIASAGAGVVFMLAIVALLVFVPDRSGPADEFDDAAETFHSRFDGLHTRLISDVQAANSGMMDPSLAPVKSGANEIENVLETYANAVSAIVVPSTAVEARDRLIRVTQAARLMMTGVAASFSKGQVQVLLNGTWPSVVSALTETETALRAALKK
jgi:hypothetical protein